VKDAAVLDPVRDSGKVVGQRIPVVGGCRAGRQSHGSGEKRETGEKRDLLSRGAIERSGRRRGRFLSSPPEARREDDREKKPRPENECAAEARHEARKLGDGDREKSGRDGPREQSFPAAERDAGSEASPSEEKSAQNQADK